LDKVRQLIDGHEQARHPVSEVMHARPEACKAGQTFTHPRSGRTFEHGCSCGNHVEVLTGNERQERDREGLIEDQCKAIQRAAQRA
jgi:hypothetical protein